MEYTLNLSSGKQIPLYFGTWSMGRFCELNGDLSFTQMQNLFANEISFKHIISVFLCGAEHWCKKNKKPFDYTDIDASDWIDEIGGATSEEFSKVMGLVGQAIDPKYQGIQVKQGREEKKSETSAGSSSE